MTNDPRAASIIGAFNYAAAQIGSMYSDPITINVRVVLSPGTSILSQSNTQVMPVGYSYAQMRGFLTSDSKTQDDATSASSLGASDPTDGAVFFLPRAQAKALGQLDAGNSALDGTFTFGGGFAYTFDPDNRSAPGAYDFIGLAFHEITEIMGRFAGLGLVLSAQDLFRYQGVGVRALNASDPNPYFSIDGGVTNLRGYNTVSGGDLGDWDNSADDAFNAFPAHSVVLPFSPVDVRQVDVIGYDAVPAPSSLVVLVAGAAVARRRARL